MILAPVLACAPALPSLEEDAETDVYEALIAGVLAELGEDLEPVHVSPRLVKRSPGGHPMSGTWPDDFLPEPSWSIAAAVERLPDVEICVWGDLPCPPSTDAEFEGFVALTTIIFQGDGTAEVWATAVKTGGVGHHGWYFRGLLVLDADLEIQR